jgi:heptose-I-phosphate ethanolaminephosphotransferase
MNADTFIDFKSKTDAPIIEAFKNIVKDSGTNKVIFIHLIGSHFAYNNRYPENFETFGGDKREQGTTQEVENASEAAKYERKKSATIDSYDNSILFGDYILHQLIEALRTTGNSSFLVFFSDHGEEVYEDGGTFLGHNSGLYPTKYRVKVPFVLWRSQKYMEEVPEIVLDTARPYNNEDFIHSLGTLMRLNYPALDSSRSIFSPYFKVRPRIVQNKPFELLNEH